MKRFSPLLLIFFCHVSFAQHMIKDITDESTLFDNGSVFNFFGAEFKGSYYFSAQSLENGFEVFYTDGTESGTSMLKEIYPGEKGIGLVVAFGATNDFLLFGFQGEDGNQLWRSDGTSEGTQKIASVDPSKARWGMVELNGVLYFAGTEEQHGMELWRSDGTSEGTFMVEDIYPRQGSSITGPLTAVGNRLYFAAHDDLHGGELWVSDGTADGTVMVKDIHPGDDWAFVTNMAVAGNSVYFINDSQIWKSDGSEEGTVAVTNFPVGESIVNEKLTIINNKLLFRHYSSSEGLEMYTLDIATGVVGLLKETFPGNYPMWSNTIYATPVLLNGMVWFFAEHDNNKFSIWKTDGTTENTLMAFDLNNKYGDWPQEMFSTGQNLFFTQSDKYLKATDGVSEPWLLTRRYASQLIGLNGKLIFNAGDPWISDGTPDGTRMIKRINKGQVYIPRTIAKTNTGFVFVTNDVDVNDNSPANMWRSDGTTAGTSMIHSFESILGGDLAVNGDKILFAAADVNTFSIWISDGTSAGTKQLKDGNWYTYTGYNQIKWAGNTGFIFSGYDIWKTDGTSTGTMKVKTLSMQYRGNAHVSFKNSFYFFLNHQLWKSDGTETGTMMVKDISPGTTSYPPYFIAGENKMYFSAYDVDHGWEVWTSDGTTSGTHMVKDVSYYMLPGDAIPIIKTIVNDVAYFVATQFGSDSEIWRTDGTEEGTYMVKDIFESPNKGSNPNILATVGNTIYFTATDSLHGYEFWKTDGTSNGTVMIKDIYPGVFSSIWSNQCAVQVINGVMYFSAIDDAHGYELWQTDGTEAGTQLVYDVNPGLLSGVSTSTGSMTSVGNRLIFTANDGMHGYELWEYLTRPELIDGVEDESPAVTVFPNPTSDRITVNAASFNAIVVKDLTGRDVITTDISDGNTTIDVSHLPRGMYVIGLVGENKKAVTTKIILN